ncbi:MAG TPA: hypothetical protein PKX27_02785 [Bacteroidales bacterium]|nr:hypothetical protein [Bacteroidales bacterium]HOX74923.1 hypothetical protein [Bacteroidales bacterium]HPM86885.1 hypothetical protein [Bacteroidales bacterium]HQM67688.1 hypothetical protein [Bacteroidales bacterium]
MKDLLRKLNYKEYNRILIMNAGEVFLQSLSKELHDVKIDTEIDQRCPYNFMIIFVKSVREVNDISPVALHNLTADGVLWYCYPKKTSKKLTSDLERDRGWKSMNDMGFYGIRMVSVDDNWSAMRFRNVKYIKSTSGRIPGQ